MDQLWSPWRYQYVSSASSSNSNTNPAETCLFCRVIAEGAAKDRENYVLLRAARSYIILNRYPYSSGHLMVAPYAHVASLEEAETETLVEMMKLAQRCEKALRRVYKPGGLNFGFNIGQCAGAGIAGHIHMHGLPRWAGDVSFISAIGETRVIPEELDTTYERISAALAET
jgi:ATP adenylyltransferase